MWSLLLNTKITYKILKNGVCYTEIQAARLEALKVICYFDTIFFLLPQLQTCFRVLSSLINHGTLQNLSDLLF